MGLIKAFSGSFNSTMADQWKEFFICESIKPSTLAIRGEKNTSKRSSNKKGNEDVISAGSIIVVNEGQAMMVISQGEVIEFSAEAGVFEYTDSKESSIFSGSLGEGIKNTFKTFTNRFTFGGEVPSNAQVYYFNLKELTGLKFGTSEPIMYDDYIYQSINLRFFGQTSLKLIDPINFYKNVCGNVEEEYTMTMLWESQLRSEFIMYLSQAMSLLANQNVKYNQITQKQLELAKHMNEILDEEWIQNRGLEIFKVGIESVSLDPDDKEKIQKIDDMRLMSDPLNATGRMTAATANAMENAADNENGAMMGFAGLNMAMNQGGSQVTQMHQMNQQQSVTGWSCTCGTSNTGKFCTNCGSENASSWNCSCNATNTGKFCTNCGLKKPDQEWTCTCGCLNTGKFCTNCGNKR